MLSKHNHRTACSILWTGIIIFVAFYQSTFALNNNKDNCRKSLVDDLTSLKIVKPSGAVSSTVQVGTPWQVQSASVHNAVKLSGRYLKTESDSLSSNLNSVSVVNEVSIWGHQGAFIAQYRVDDTEKAWRFITDETAKPKVFRAVKSKANLPENKLLEAVIAKQFRFIPVSVAGSKGSFQFDLIGCPFDGEPAHFTGYSKIETDLEKTGPIATTVTDLEILMKTESADGVIVSSVGSADDFILVQINTGRIQAIIDYGSGIPLTLDSRVAVNDGLWHRIQLKQGRRRLKLLIDGIMDADRSVLGKQTELNLDRKLLIGCPVLVNPILDQAGLVKSNYSGLISMLKIGGEDLMGGERTKVGKDMEIDLSPDDACATFESTDAWIKLKDLEGQENLNFSFEFRTISTAGRLVEIPFSGREVEKMTLLVEKGRLKFDLVGKKLDKEMFETRSEAEFAVSDFLWHKVQVETGLNNGIPSVTVTLDAKVPVVIQGKMLARMTPDGNVIFGSTEDGFEGLIRNVRWNGDGLTISERSEHGGTVQYGTCYAIDGCQPNPCENGGSCLRKVGSYTCSCSEGYSGENCHTVSLPKSCEQHLALDGELGKTWLDIDGVGELRPFQVYCNKTESGISTILTHDRVAPIEVRGFPKRGSFEEYLEYGPSPAALDRFVRSFERCFQRVRYECYGGAKFLNGDNGRAQSWWMGRTGNRAYAWGAPEYMNKMCTCGMEGTCVGNGTCNCDSGKDTVDEAELTLMDQLPLKKMFLGDTDSERKRAVVSIGPLECMESLAWKPVTFTQRDARMQMELDPSPGNNNVWISVDFEFKTTQPSGVFVYNQEAESSANTDWIKIYLQDSNELVAEISASGSLQTVVWRPKMEGRLLSDNLWHSVQFDMTRSYAELIVDGKGEEASWKEEGFMVVPRLGRKWLIGASFEYSAGFAGVMRGVVINAEHQTLQKIAKESPLKGISPGVVRKCDEEMCFHGGLCIELYDGYRCDCSKTPFKGNQCLEDLGYEFNGKGWMQYNMKPSQSRQDGRIKIGFQTLSKDAVLLRGGFFWSDDIALELQITAEGFLSLGYFDGAKSYRLLDDRKNYSDGTFYALDISAVKNSFIMQVGYYESLKLKTGEKSVDADGIKKWTIGSKNYTGCLSRLQLGNAAPFQKSDSEFSRLKIEGDMNFVPAICPLARVGKAQMRNMEWSSESLAVEEREPVGLPSIVVEPVKMRDTSGIVVASLSVVVLVAVLLFCCCWRCFRNRPAGEYKTHEGDTLYLTPDNSHTALVAAVPPRRREWFI